MAALSGTVNNLHHREEVSLARVTHNDAPQDYKHCTFSVCVCVGGGVDGVANG